jgi:M3 family oligoendopeptidase
MQTATLPFTEFPYERPDLDTISAEFRGVLEQFRQASSPAEAISALEALYAVRNNFESMREIASIRYTIDTRDPFYEGEQGFFDREQPRFAGLINAYYEALLASPHREALEAEFGAQLVNMARLVMKTYSPEIVADLQEENELTTAYRKIKASASIDFEGEPRNLMAMMAFMRHKDRDLRRRAAEAYWSFMKENQVEMDRIFQELVQVRHRIATKLGYKNYVQLGYDRLGRTDYGSVEVARFRQQVLDEVVPLATAIKQQQQARIGVDSLKYYDEEYMFRSGNPEPLGDPEWIVEEGRKMYEELCPETEEFIHFMLDARLMDLVTKPGKASGGYCTYIHNHKAPFIFSNFNGTAMDIFVLTHEAGHAFQVYQSRHFPFNEYNWPTMEACEIHSMSMEFFTWPWMERFFGASADKFRYMHLLKALLFLPYGVAVDEFQHVVYENPEMTPDERAAAWKTIEKRYLPHKDYDGNAYLEAGRAWQMQSHIYEVPFYYIDYTLAQICAFQFWAKAEEDRQAALADYVRLCEAGGSKPFLELVKFSGLDSPFEEGTVASSLGKISAWLSKVDDLALETA